MSSNLFLLGCMCLFEECNKKADLKKQHTGDDVKNFVNGQLFPYLKSFRTQTHDIKSLQYKICSISGFVNDPIVSGHTLRDVLDIVDSLNFQNSAKQCKLSMVYENLLKCMVPTAAATT